MGENIVSLGADRHAQADLPCPLGDAYEHDIHDADAAYQQRDGRNGSQKRRHRAGGSGECAGDIGQVANVEIIGGADRDLVTFSLQGRYLLLRTHGIVGGLGTDLDAAADVLLQASLNLGLKGRFGDEHDVVAVLTLHRLPLGEQDARHLKGNRNAELQQVLPRLETLLQAPQFKAADATGVFNIEATDWGATVLVPRFIEILTRDAPGVQIAIFPKHIGFETLERGEVDLAFAIDSDFAQSATRDLKTEPLFRQKMVCVVRKGHQLTEGRLTFRRYAKAQHLSLEPMQARGVFARAVPEAQGLVEAVLNRQSVRRDVRVRLPFFAPAG